MIAYNGTNTTRLGIYFFLARLASYGIHDEDYHARLLCVCTPFYMVGECFGTVLKLLRFCEHYSVLG